VVSPRPSIDPADHDATVSRALRGQALSSLRELLIGLRGADLTASRARLAGQEGMVYAGLASVVLRLFFVLFAEDRGLLPMDTGAYATLWSLTGLHARLREDAARPGSALEQRYGAWTRITTLFRALHDGASEVVEGFSLSARRGALFDPDAYPFLEGRSPGEPHAPAALSLISDASVLRALDPLLTLDGEPLRYGELDVEHLGTVYEGLMGYEIQIAEGPSLTLRPDDVVVDLAALAALPCEARIPHLADEAGLLLTGKLARLVKAATTPEALGAALAARASKHERAILPRGALFLQPGEERRRSGAHYTSRAVTRVLVERTLAPLLTEATSADTILTLKVCDPAMGGGALLVEACRQLAEHLARAWERESLADQSLERARRLVATRCLHGVDKNPLAVHLARLSIWLIATARDEPFTFVDHALRCGDSLVGLSALPIAGASIDVGADAGEQALSAARSRADLALWAFFSTRDRRARARAMTAMAARAHEDPAAPELAARIADVRARYAPFHWSVEFPGVFSGPARGFDVIVGNPPWVSYSGRAAQPLQGELRDFYAAASPAFHGFRNLQGLFVHRFAEMLRPGGRLGLVLPTSTSDLGGYEPVRRAHDALSICDDDLPDFGEKAFDGVFQPSMGLLSTRRPARISLESSGAWPLERRDLDPETRALVEKLSALPPLPPRLFGERGFQSTSADLPHLRPGKAPDERFTTAVRVGGDIEPFLRRSAEIYCDPGDFGGRLRAASEWRTVKLLIRQTARYPMVVLSDGEAFRNSILAGFADAEWSEHLLLAYLNSTPVRWLHYTRHRDARQGMPQLKIAHLRAVPAPPLRGDAREALIERGRALGERNTGITAPEQEDLDALVAEILSLDEPARARIRAFAAAMRR
jgi:Eco57I restriction-modification methylase